MNYRQRIRDLREDADKTQTQIADYLGTSQTMYARYERGVLMKCRSVISLLYASIIKSRQTIYLASPM